MNAHPKIETVEIHDPRPPAYSDDALALRFSERHGETMRYVAAWGRWLEWRVNHWQFDETVVVFDMARAVCREAAAECNQAKIASAIASAKTVSAVERLARSDRRHAATVDQWDADPWLLNTPGGVIDLRSGANRPAQPEDHMTKITAVGPGGECPRWLKFLDEITASDAELQSYLRRVLGYALTGDTREHALFFGYGTGRNGKSVLLKTAADILGNYHKRRRASILLRPAIPTGIRQTWPACRARASSRPSRRKKADAGRSCASRR